MPNNFKLTGDYYVSIDGSDSNDGLTKNTPKRTIQAGLNIMVNNSTLIIGSGVYREFIASQVGALTRTIRSDGLVVIEPNSGSSGYFFLGSNGGNFTTISGPIIIRNYGTISHSNGFLFATDVSYINNSSFTTASPLAGSTFTRCIFINTSLTHSVSSYNYNYCLLFNSSIFGNFIGSFVNSYVSLSSILTTISSITIANFNYNNIQGSIIMNTAATGTSGSFQDAAGYYCNLAITGTTGDGTIGNPYTRDQIIGRPLSYTNHRLAYPTYNANSMSVDPLFNNIQAQDFTLQASSPMIARASDGISNIGGTKYAIRDAANGDVFNTSAISVTNLAFLGNDYIVSGAASGEVVGAPRFIGSIAKVIQKMSYNGLLEFNKALGTGPVNGNRNVPDQLVYTTGTQGANPDRLVYYLRFSTQVAQPATSGEWDNAGLWTAGNYETFEWNTKPSIDLSAKGNGDPAFNSADTPTYLQATWIQIKVKLRNDYI